jgi:eukaryotic-like serine/threonine-protein kinase
MTSAIGTRVGPYEIVSALGAGGMGEVYRARDPRLGRDVALKVIKRDFIGNSSHRARFERESRALASLNHPNIATSDGIEMAGHRRGVWCHSRFPVPPV